MTRDKDFKALVRSRMRRHNESYTTARAALLVGPPSEDRRWRAARREQQLIVARWFDDDQLRALPARRKIRAAVLLEVLSHFVPGSDYPESQVSRRLRRIHPDFACLRRELVGLGYLERSASVYWVCRTPPVRTELERRELPAWEAIWLPAFVAGGTDRIDREAS
ncbi:hypothetical protein GCM10011575_32360 [Microlunatus endophyticus]|uniref:DUF2087 domain-containing protein n=1 Tax=Microlunatus endophyticus TaxID=1716077 RepID=A0A917SC57_9ACTN|nr:DUF2087 domain-containing protein [Microlunatus endophyticus]GGL71563.1 hypothetical protein GCM10011575_32360 [Microlunatus endophyticus]